MRSVVIIGAGGHAQVIADILMAAARAGAQDQVVGFVDDDRSIHGSLVMGLPVFGGTDMLPSIDHGAAIVGIGDNRSRARLFDQLVAAGETLAIAVHPTAVLAQGVVPGPGSVVCAGAIVNTGAVLGANVALNTACSVDHHNVIGDHVHIGPGAHLAGQVRVGCGAFVGIGATVSPRVSIGDWSIVGAGAVAIRSVDSGSVVAGVPARRIR